MDSFETTEEIMVQGGDEAPAVKAPPPPCRLFDPANFERRALSALSRPVPPKLPFDFEALDQHLDGGFPAGAMIILGSPPKHHKTAFLIDRAVAWAQRGVRVAYVTTELTLQEACARLSARLQFGTTNKWHSRIKHEPHLAVENFEPLRHLGGMLEVFSLLDEEAKADGWRWDTIVEALREEASRGLPLVLIADYIEEIAMRLEADRGATETERNKAALVQLRDLAVQSQVRVLAVCSVARGTYGNAESIFKKADALPEEFCAVVKHTGFGEYAASAILALQLPQNQADADINDPATGHRCLPMKLHLAVTREGKGPVTVPVLSFAGSCRFAADLRGPVVKVNPLEKPILELLAKPVNRKGLSIIAIVKKVKRGRPKVVATLDDLQERGAIVVDEGPRGAMVYKHSDHAPIAPAGDATDEE